MIKRWLVRLAKTAARLRSAGMMRRSEWAALVLIQTLLLPAAQPALGAEPDASAASGILIDAGSGQILWERDAHERRPVASTTKILTGILVIEHAKLSDTVQATEEATEAGGAEIYLDPGEKRTVDELLYAMMLKSANDAAAALAIHVGGSIEGFSDLMNRKALALGARDSHFSSPNGLHQPDHYSSAHDLALIARYAMKNTTFRRLVSTKRRVIPWPGKQYARTLNNHNGLLERYPSAIGIKTGYTRQAGQCLVSAARKGDRELIAVLLKSPSGESLYRDSTALLEFGFNEFRPATVLKSGQAVAKIRRQNTSLPLVAGRDLTALLPLEGAETEILAMPSGKLSGTFRSGRDVGQAAVFSKGHLAGKVPLVVGKLPKDYEQRLDRRGALTRAWQWVRGLFGS